MVCPNKNSELFIELENYLGDEVKADIAFRLNKNKLPDYKKHPDFKLYKQYYGIAGAFNTIFNEEVAKYEERMKAKETKQVKPMTLNDFLKKWPMTSKFLPSKYSPSQVAKDAKEVGLNVKKASNGSYYLTRNGRGFDPSSPVFKLSESAKKNPEKVMEAEKKWIKSKLGKDFPVDIAHQPILGQAWGMFSDQAISLYKNAGEGTGYHETFHAVFRMALTPREKEAILLEMQAREGNQNKTDAELEEDLADEFAEYIMRDGKMELPQAQNNFFSKLLMFIKDLFNLDIDIASLYEGIDEGRFYNLHLDYASRNHVSPETGVAFKRLPIELTRINNNGIKIPNSTLTEGETIAIMESLDSAFFKTIFKEEDPAALFKKPKWNVKKTYEKVRKKMIDDETFLNAIDSMVDAGISDFKIDDYEKIIDAVFGIKYDTNIENYVVDPKKDFLWQTTVEAHLNRLKDYGVKTNGYNIDTESTFVSADDYNSMDADMEDSPETEKETNDSAMYKASIEFDAKDGIPPAAKAMLLGITQKSIDKDGKIYTAPTDLNDMYFPKLVDNGKLFTLLASNLVGYSGDFTGMVDKLRSFTEEHPEHASSIRQVMSRLNLQNTTYVSTHRLKTAFTQAFSKAKLTQALTLLREDGTIGLLDSNTDTLRNKLLSEWDSKFKVKAKRTDIGEPYISANNIGAALAKSKQLNKTVGAMMFLKDMGISIDRRALYVNIDGESVVDRIFNMLETFENSSLIDPFNNKEIKGTLNAIAVAQTEYSSDIVELSHLNPEGKRVYGITLNTEITLIAEKMNRYAGQGDAIYEFMPYLNNPYTGNSIFLNEIKKRGGKLQIGLLEGTKSETVKEGTVTKKLGITDKFSQTIDATLKGRYPLLRAGDRGIENSIALNGGELLITNRLNGIQIFKKYLADEIATMRVKISDKLEHFNRNKEFRFFQDIITDSVIEPTMLKTMLNSKEDPLKMIESDDTINSNVEKAISDYFKNETTKTIKFLKEEAGIDKNTGIDTELLNQYESFKDLIENYVYNSTAGYIEQTKLFIGDPIYFKDPTDFFKRISMFNSTKKVSRNDQEYNDFMNSKRKEGEKVYDGIIRTAVFEDIEKGTDLINNLKETLKAKYKNKSSEELDKILKPYTKYEEADAQGYVSLEAYREIMDRAGDWTAEHEKLYNMIIDGRKLPDSAFVYFNPLKTQYAGPMQDFENQLFVPTAAKHSLFPIHPRLLPEGSELAEVAEQMKEKGLDFIQFKSANKYGTKLNADGNMNTFYNDNGEVNINAENLSTQNLYFDFFGIQLDLLGDTKTKITPGSQASKLIMANLFVDGKPLPGYETIANEYTDTVNKLTAYNEAQVEKDLGVGKNVTGRYVVTDLDVFKTTLQRINSDKNVDDNVKDSLATLEQEDKLEYLPNFDKIQSVLTSYVNKNIIRAKRPGGAKVQVASTGFIKAKKADGKYGSDRLKFYRKDKSGVMAMQVLLPHWMKNVKANIAPGELDSKLNKLIGFRIPTQGPSSIELIEIVGYLPPEAGDAIVVPSEHVAKTGSDFDIDKLNIYYPSYDVVDGKPVYITQEYERKGKDFTKEKLHNKLLELQIEIASSDSYFADMVTPLDSELLKEVRNSIKDPATMSMTQMFSGVTNMEKFRDFLAGKAGVGQVAIHITHHALSQVAGLSATTGDFLFYDHNKNEAGLPSFGKQTSENDQYYISDVLSGFLNAYVDIAKDPYIFDLNAGSQTANTIFFMLRNGADPEWVMHFISQPILKEYVKQSGINESLTFKHKGKDRGAEAIITNILKKRGLSKADMYYKKARKIGYYPTSDEKNINEINKIKAAYNKQIPLSTLKSNHKSNQHNIQQRVLDEFLMYQDQAKLLQDSVKGAAVDTKGMGKSFDTVYELYEILNKIDKAGYIENNDKLFNNTFLKGYKSTLSKYHSVFTDKTILTGEIRENLAILYNNIKSNVMPSARERLRRDLESQYINYLFNLGLENDPSLNRTQIEQFFDKDRLAGMVSDLKKDPALNKNLLIKELITYFDEGSFATHGMKMYSKKFDTYTKNALIDSFRELFGLRINGVNIGEFIAKFGLVQGGTRNTLTSYGDLIPYEKFKLYLKENLKKGISSQKFSDFEDMFLRTNVNYLRRVKYTVEGKKRLLYKKYETEAKQPYLVNYEKNLKGKYSPVLYEPSTITGKGEVIFKPSDRGIIGNAPYRFDFRGINHIGNKTVKWDPRNAKNVKEAKKTQKKCK